MQDSVQHKEKLPVIQ